MTQNIETSKDDWTCRLLGSWTGIDAVRRATITPMGGGVFVNPEITGRIDTIYVSRGSSSSQYITGWDIRYDGSGHMDFILGSRGVKCGPEGSEVEISQSIHLGDRSSLKVCCEGALDVRINGFPLEKLDDDVWKWDGLPSAESVVFSVYIGNDYMKGVEVIDD